MKDLLLSYRLEGETAERLFTSNPEAAAASEISDPENGLGVMISAHLDELQQLRDGLKATAILLRQNEIEEFIYHIDRFEQLSKVLVDLVLATEYIKAYAKPAVAERTSDEDA